MNPKILIISPVRNESAHIERVARALAAQELRPARWIVIDDSSTDQTYEVLERMAPELPFLDLRRAEKRVAHAGSRDRLARAAAPRTFNAGVNSVDWHEYTHVMKLDGDIELPANYFRLLMERFAADPRLGCAGGTIVEPTPDGGLYPVRIPLYHVHGAVKCYSRACFEAIGGVQERLGWDTIDETYARMRGFTTVSFPELACIHHRPCGSADGILRSRARYGECAYVSHYPPVWIALRSFKEACERPRGLCGAAFIFGYLRAAARRVEQVPDREYRRFARRELHRRIARRDLAGRAALT